MKLKNKYKEKERLIMIQEIMDDHDHYFNSETKEYKRARKGLDKLSMAELDSLWWMLTSGIG